MLLSNHCRKMLSPAVHTRGASDTLVPVGAVKGRALEPAKCPRCEFQSKRLTSFEAHLAESHGTTAEAEWVAVNGRPTCKCGCGSPVKWVGWKQGFTEYVLGHNGNLGHLGAGGEAIKEARKKSLRESIQRGEVTNWALGKTKETDATLATAAAKRSATVSAQFKSGQRVAWSKGLTKSTDGRLMSASLKSRSDYASGKRVPWAKGLRKETSPAIRKMAANVSISLRKEGLRLRLGSLKRLKVDEVVSRIESSGNLTVVGGMDQYVNDLTPVIQVRCNSCGSVHYDSLRRLQRGRCFSCMPSGSAAQQEITVFLQSLGLEVKNSVRSALNGLEIDAYVPSHRFGVEYNGLYWHSELHKSSTYHENKTQQARQAGIVLLQVFEDDWRDRRYIVESLVRHRLGLTPEKVGARKLFLRRVSSWERKSFFDANHIDGDAPSTAAWALCRGDEVLAALSVRKPFHKAYSGYMEVARFCTKVGVSVAGGLGRLTAEATSFCKERNAKGLITYVDNRLGSGGGYEAAGFKLVSKTPPRFWWTDFDDRMNRFKFKADPSRGMTEAQVADEAGVVKIWGCSNLVYKLDVHGQTSIGVCATQLERGQRLPP